MMYSPLPSQRQWLELRWRKCFVVFLNIWAFKSSYTTICKNPTESSKIDESFLTSFVYMKRIKALFIQARPSLMRNCKLQLNLLWHACLSNDHQSNHLFPMNSFLIFTNIGVTQTAKGFTAWFNLANLNLLHWIVFKIIIS